MGAAETLTQLLAAHGRALCDDPRRLEALLRDLCGEERRAIFVLVNALRERVAVDLLGWPAGVPPALLHARLAQRLEASLGFAPDVARWTVETWAGALAAVPGGAGGGLPAPPAGRGGADARRPEWPLRPEAEEDFVAFELAGFPRTVRRVAREPGAAEFATIGAAIAGASPGTRILVAPGVYAEGIVLDRPVEIVPDRDAGPGAVVVEAAESSCLLMATGYAVVRGLVLRGCTGLERRTCFAVDVPQGHLVLEDCEVTSDALAGVAIRGRSACPVLRRCQIRDGKGSGVFVHEGGTGTLEDCAVVGNALAGIEVGRDGNPTLRRCVILDGRGPGVYVSLGGAGTFEDCAVSGNGGAGVEIGWLGRPVLRRCRVTHNGQHAVRLYDGGGGTFETCDLSGNALGAWDVADGWVQHNGARANGHTCAGGDGDRDGDADRLGAPERG
jgi:hypothetical protein